MTSSWKTKVPYPQVIRRLLELLNCSIDLQGCYDAAGILQSYKAVKICLGPEAGLYEGCYDDEKIDAEVAKNVLATFPQLIPLVEDFRSEGSSYGSLCGWLNKFIEDVAWLSGNRRTPFDNCVFVKRVVDDEGEHTCVGEKSQCGIMFLMDDRYKIQARSGEYGLVPDEILGIYPTAFEAAFDGWSVD